MQTCIQSICSLLPFWLSLRAEHLKFILYLYLYFFLYLYLYQIYLFSSPILTFSQGWAFAGYCLLSTISLVFLWKAGHPCAFYPKDFYLGCKRDVGICWLFEVSVASYSEFVVCWKLGIFTSVDFVSLWCFPFLSAFHFALLAIDANQLNDFWFGNFGKYAILHQYDSLDSCFTHCTMAQAMKLRKSRFEKSVHM